MKYLGSCDRIKECISKGKNAETLINYIIVVLHDSINVVTNRATRSMYITVVYQKKDPSPLSFFSVKKEYLHEEDGRSEGGNYAIDYPREIQL